MLFRLSLSYHPSKLLSNRTQFLLPRKFSHIEEPTAKSINQDNTPATPSAQNRTFAFRRLSATPLSNSTSSLENIIPIKSSHFDQIHKGNVESSSQIDNFIPPSRRVHDSLLANKRNTFQDVNGSRGDGRATVQMEIDSQRSQLSQHYANSTSQRNVNSAFKSPMIANLPSSNRPSSFSLMNESKNRPIEGAQHKFNSNLFPSSHRASEPDLRWSDHVIFGGSAKAPQLRKTTSTITRNSEWATLSDMQPSQRLMRSSQDVFRHGRYSDINRMIEKRENWGSSQEIFSQSMHTQSQAGRNLIRTESQTSNQADYFLYEDEDEDDDHYHPTRAFDSNSQYMEDTQMPEGVSNSRNQLSQSYSNGPSIDNNSAGNEPPSASMASISQNSQINADTTAQRQATSSLHRRMQFMSTSPDMYRKERKIDIDNLLERGRDVNQQTMATGPRNRKIGLPSRNDAHTMRPISKSVLSRVKRCDTEREIEKRNSLMKYLNKRRQDPNDVDYNEAQYKMDYVRYVILELPIDGDQ